MHELMKGILYLFFFSFSLLLLQKASEHLTISYLLIVPTYLPVLTLHFTYGIGNTIGWLVGRKTKKKKKEKKGGEKIRSDVCCWLNLNPDGHRTGTRVDV